MNHLLNRNNFLKLYNLDETQLDQLRPMSSLLYSEINEICSILLNKECTCGSIEWVEQKDFLVAKFKVEETYPHDKYDRVEMGITIDSNFQINYNWDYCYAKGTEVSSQNLYNHNEITAYLIFKKFDIYGLNKKED